MNGNAFGNETIKLVIPDKPFALIFDLFSFLQDNINWISCIQKVAQRTSSFRKVDQLHNYKMYIPLGACRFLYFALHIIVHSIFTLQMKQIIEQPDTLTCAF